MNHPSLSVAEQRALDTASDLVARAAVSGDAPVGAVLLTAQGIVAGLGLNQREIPSHDPTAHAEIVAIREAAGRLRTWNLAGCILVVTLEPCTMCAGAIVAARTSWLIFGAWDSKARACGSIRDMVRDSRLNHQVEVTGGVAEKRGVALLQDFFGKRRPNLALNSSPNSRLDSSPQHSLLKR